MGGLASHGGSIKSKLTVRRTWYLWVTTQIPACIAKRTSTSRSRYGGPRYRVHEAECWRPVKWPAQHLHSCSHQRLAKLNRRVGITYAAPPIVDGASLSPLSPLTRFPAFQRAISSPPVLVLQSTSIIADLTVRQKATMPLCSLCLQVVRAEPPLIRVAGREPTVDRSRSFGALQRSAETCELCRVFLQSSLGNQSLSGGDDPERRFEGLKLRVEVDHYNNSNRYQSYPVSASDVDSWGLRAYWVREVMSTGFVLCRELGEC